MIAATDSQVADFHSSLTENRYFDTKIAIGKFLEVGMSPSDLADKVIEFHESAESSIKDIDFCSVAYDHVLQMARNKIDKILNFDICKDIKNGTGFYICVNTMCTSYDYSQEAIHQLEEKLKDAGTEPIEELLDDIFVKVFLKDVNINIKEIRKTGSEKQEVAN